MAVSAGTTALVGARVGRGRPRRGRAHRRQLAACSARRSRRDGRASASLGRAVRRRVRPRRARRAQLAATYIRWISVFNVVYRGRLRARRRPARRRRHAHAAADRRRSPTSVNMLLLYVLVYGGFGLSQASASPARRSSGGLAFTRERRCSRSVCGCAASCAIAPVRGGLLDRAAHARAVADRLSGGARADGRPVRLHRLHVHHRALLRHERAGGVRHRRADPVAVVRGRLRLLDRRLDAGRPAPRRRRSASARAQSGWRAMALAVGSMSRAVGADRRRLRAPDRAS